MTARPRKATRQSHEPRAPHANGRHQVSAAILVISDEAITRRGIQSIVEQQPGWKVVGAVRSSQEAVTQAAHLRPDIVIVDIGTPNFSGVESARSILKNMPEMRVLGIGASNAEETVFAALDAGILGCASKTDADQELILGINALLRGRTFFPAPVFKRLREISLQAPPSPARTKLTERERQIIRLLAEGNNNREVAAALGISVRTVEDSRAKIMKKLSLRRFSELVHFAIRNGLVDL